MATKVISREEFMAARTNRGGWNRKQLAAWGEPWPPVKGWKKRLLGTTGSTKIPSTRKVKTCKSHPPVNRQQEIVKVNQLLLHHTGLIARFDGACWPNPNGKATCAATVEYNGQRLVTFSEHVGTGEGMTNNVAEFAGVKLILQWLVENNIVAPVLIMGDSQIAINRMSTRTLPSGLCRNIAGECIELARTCMGPIVYRWVPRELNAVCDSLADDAQHKDASPYDLLQVPAVHDNLPYWSSWEFTD